MKNKILSIIFFSILITGCEINYTEGWTVINKSNQEIEVFFNKTPLTVRPDSKAFYEDISENAKVSISDSYHVNYETSEYYRVSEGKHASKLLTITDKTKYQYKILNSSAYNVTFTIDDTSNTIASGDTQEITVYDDPIDFHFMYDNFEIPYTKNTENGITYIYISN